MDMGEVAAVGSCVSDSRDDASFDRFPSKPIGEAVYLETGRQPPIAPLLDHNYASRGPHSEEPRPSPPPAVEAEAEVDRQDPEGAPAHHETREEWQGEDYVTRCVCGYQHDDGYMISCDKCMVWQHVDCMSIERGNIPEVYFCEECQPREVDRKSAAQLQKSKKQLFEQMKEGDPSNSDGENMAASRGSRGKKLERSRKAGSATRVKKKEKDSPRPVLVKKKNISKREIRPVRRYSDPGSDRDSSGLRNWIDNYEEAITNHYSPELRARLSALKGSDLHCPRHLFGAYASLDSRTRLTSAKVLVAAGSIPPSQPILEIRGKYMLSKGGELAETDTKGGLVFSHSLHGPGQLLTHVEVDTSTYGNKARFVRSSCHPNAQILHCIEKGTLRLYIMSTGHIDSKKEITLPHRPGAGCVLADKCSLISPRKRRTRKEVLVDRETANLNNRKRSSSSEQSYTPKATKADTGLRRTRLAAKHSS